MAEACEITKIEPLNGLNYPTWKYNIKLLLMERGLWDFVSGTEERPGEDATAQVKNAYRLKSDKAYSLIALSVNKNIQVHISTTTATNTKGLMTKSIYPRLRMAEIHQLFKTEEIYLQ